MVLFLLEIMEYWCNEAGLLRYHTVHFMSGIIVNHIIRAMKSCQDQG